MCVHFDTTHYELTALICLLFIIAVLMGTSLCCFKNFFMDSLQYVLITLQSMLW